MNEPFARKVPSLGQTVMISEGGRRVGNLVITSVSPQGNRCDGFYSELERGLRVAFWRLNKHSNVFTADPGMGPRLMNRLFILS